MVTDIDLQNKRLSYHTGTAQYWLLVDFLKLIVAELCLHVVHLSVRLHV